MQLSSQMLVVYPNPFTALDKHGTPRGVVARMDPGANPEAPNYIGATISKKRVGPVHERPSLLYTQIHGAASYEMAPVLIPDTDYHRTLVRSGSLVAADAATARRAGVPFAPPEDILNQARAAAVAEYQRERHEEPDYARWREAGLTPPGEPIIPPEPPIAQPNQTASTPAASKGSDIIPPEPPILPPSPPEATDPPPEPTGSASSATSATTEATASETPARKAARRGG